MTPIRGIYMPYNLYECWACRLQEEMQTRPLSGMLALYWCLMHEAREIFLTGMNFYEMYINRGSKIGSHDIDSNMSWLREVSKRPEVKLDSELSKILSAS